jgi:hypothetical protein
MMFHFVSGTVLADLFNPSLSRGKKFAPRDEFDPSG